MGWCKDGGETGVFRLLGEVRMVWDMSFSRKKFTKVEIDLASRFTRSRLEVW